MFFNPFLKRKKSLMNLKKNDIVLTSLGEGYIVSIRNGPPDFSEPEAVSVFLECKKNEPGYYGTMFLAKDIRLKE